MCNFLFLIYLLRHLSRTYRRQTDRFTMSYFEKLVTWIFEICQSKYKDSLLTIYWVGIKSPALGQSLEAARHWSDDTRLQGRAFLRSEAGAEAGLVLDQVQPGDQATYTCRVDFKLAPTTISLVNLTVQSECYI